MDGKRADRCRLLLSAAAVWSCNLGVRADIPIAPVNLTGATFLNTLAQVAGEPDPVFVHDPNDVYTDGRLTTLELSFVWTARVKLCNFAGTWVVGSRDDVSSETGCKTGQPHVWDASGDVSSPSVFSDLFQVPKYAQCSSYTLPSAFGSSIVGCGLTAKVPICSSSQDASDADSYQLAFVSDQRLGYTGCYAPGPAGASGVIPQRGSGSYSCQNVTAIYDGDTLECFIVGGAKYLWADRCATNGGMYFGAQSAKAEWQWYRSMKFLWVDHQNPIKRPDTSLVNITLRWDTTKRMFCNGIMRICYARVWFQDSNYLYVKSVKYKLSAFTNAAALSSAIGSGSPMQASLNGLLTGLITVSSEAALRTEEFILYTRAETLATALMLYGRESYIDPKGDPLIICDTRAARDFRLFFSMGRLRVSISGVNGSGVVCTFAPDNTSADLTLGWSSLYRAAWVGNLDANFTMEKLIDLSVVVNLLADIISPLTSPLQIALYWILISIFVILNIFALWITFGQLGVVGNKNLAARLGANRMAIATTALVVCNVLVVIINSPATKVGTTYVSLL